VVIEHFVMIQDPLYGRLRLILGDDGPRWHTFDLEMWRGRRPTWSSRTPRRRTSTTWRRRPAAAPRDTSPSGGPSCPTWARRPCPRRGATGPLGDDPVDSPLALAGRYGRAVSESLAALADGSLPDRGDAEARAVLLAWLVERGLLDLDGTPAGRLGALRESFRRSRPVCPSPGARRP
jgi:hypothetical protein